MVNSQNCEIFLLLTVLFSGVETHCDGRQNRAQCYGALGGTVDIQLMDSTSEIPRYYLLKNSLRILDVRNNKVILNTIKHTIYRYIFNIVLVIYISHNISDTYILCFPCY
uniref:Uncharacterized protein n=1 Tax=Amphilophus citrinellus TaxID=61819 RepID=A0A3Q0SC99_AMPCI